MKKEEAIFLSALVAAFFCGTGTALTSISDQQYLDSYFNLSTNFYNNAPVGSELLDIIQYYLTSSANLGPGLNTVGTHSGKQIRTILDLYGGPCDDCSNGGACTTLNSKCCCHGKEYLCINSGSPPGSTVLYVWSYSSVCTKGCCGGDVCCYDPSAGDNCYGDSECYEKRGPCYICSTPGGSCTLSANQCTADANCIDSKGAGWRCISNCCIPVSSGDACTNDVQCTTYGTNWKCQIQTGASSGYCAYVGNFQMCSDGTPVGRCSTANPGQICTENALMTGTQLGTSSHCPAPLMDLAEQDTTTSIETTASTQPVEPTNAPEKKPEDKSVKLSIPFLGDVSIPWF